MSFTFAKINKAKLKKRGLPVRSLLVCALILASSWCFAAEEVASGWVIRSGTWTAEGSRITGRGSLMSTKIYSDFDLEFKLTYTKVESTKACFAVLWCVASKSLYPRYEFMIGFRSSNSASLSRGGKDKRDVTKLGQTSISAPVAKLRHARFRVTKKGGIMRVCFGSKVVLMTKETDPLPAGYIVFQVPSANEVILDDVRIKRL